MDRAKRGLGVWREGLPTERSPQEAVPLDQAPRARIRRGRILVGAGIGLSIAAVGTDLALAGLENGSYSTAGPLVGLGVVAGVTMVLYGLDKIDLARNPAPEPTRREPIFLVTVIILGSITVIAVILSWFGELGLLREIACIFGGSLSQASC